MDDFQEFKRESTRLLKGYEAALAIDDQFTASDYFEALRILIGDWAHGESERLFGMRSTIYPLAREFTSRARSLIRHHSKQDRDHRQLLIALDWMGPMYYKGVPWDEYEPVPVGVFVERLKTIRARYRAGNDSVSWVMSVIAHWLPLAVANWRPLLCCPHPEGSEHRRPRQFFG